MPRRARRPPTTQRATWRCAIRPPARSTTTHWCCRRASRICSRSRMSPQRARARPGCRSCATWSCCSRRCARPARARASSASPAPTASPPRPRCWRTSWRAPGAAWRRAPISARRPWRCRCWAMAASMSWKCHLTCWSGSNRYASMPLSCSISAPTTSTGTATWRATPWRSARSSTARPRTTWRWWGSTTPARGRCPIGCARAPPGWSRFRARHARVGQARAKRGPTSGATGEPCAMPRARSWTWPGRRRCPARTTRRMPPPPRRWPSRSRCRAPPSLPACCPIPACRTASSASARSTAPAASMSCSSTTARRPMPIRRRAPWSATSASSGLPGGCRRRAASSLWRHTSRASRRPC